MTRSGSCDNGDVVFCEGRMRIHVSNAVTKRTVPNIRAVAFVNTRNFRRL